ncbi:MAG: hypothetical protein V4568_10655, partial [Pseudomonadota bacterium]
TYFQRSHRTTKVPAADGIVTNGRENEEARKDGGSREFVVPLPSIPPVMVSADVYKFTIGVIKSDERKKEKKYKINCYDHHYK